MKYSKQDQAESMTRLQEWIKPGDTVYTILRNRSRSGMQREIGLVLLKNGIDLHPNYAAACVMGDRLGKHDGVIVGGCGMDMGFHLVYNLSRTMFPNGFGCTGKNCPSNDHSNGDRNYKTHDAVGGCHEKHCVCHDPSSWENGGYPNGCSSCGCHRRPHWHNDGGYALRHRWL